MRFYLRFFSLLGVMAMLAVLPAPTMAGAQQNDSPKCDFNSDGFADLPVGSPGETISGLRSAGLVHIFYGNSTGFDLPETEAWHQASPGVYGRLEGGDQFGSSLACGDLTGDGISDLAVGSRGEDIGNETRSSGAVFLLVGSPGGLTGGPSRGWHPYSPGMPDELFTNETKPQRFGDSLSIGDLTGDGFNDLLVDVGLETTQLLLIEGSANGLADASVNHVPENSPRVKDEVIADVTGDGIGDVVASQVRDGEFSEGPHGLVITGKPSDGSRNDFILSQRFANGAAQGGATAGDFNGDGIKDAAFQGDNEVHVVEGPVVDFDSVTFSKDSPGVAGTAQNGDAFGDKLASGDFDGDGFDDLAVGTPLDDIGEDIQTGSLSVLYGSTSGLQTVGSDGWHQNTDGVTGKNETGDRFGSFLWADDFDDDGFDDLAVGVPQEFINNRRRAGRVVMLWGAAAGLTTRPGKSLSQGGSIPGAIETRDFFGTLPSG